MKANMIMMMEQGPWMTTSSAGQKVSNLEDTVHMHQVQGVHLEQTHWKSAPYVLYKTHVHVVNGASLLFTLNVLYV